MLHPLAQRQAALEELLGLGVVATLHRDDTAEVQRCSKLLFIAEGCVQCLAGLDVPTREIELAQEGREHATHEQTIRAFVAGDLRGAWRIGRSSRRSSQSRPARSWPRRCQ